MTRRFEGKVAIVTGAASGIGLATALRLGSEGARVVVADLNLARAQQAAQQVLQAGAPAALGLACDVSHEEQVAACVDRTIADLGAWHVVVNNAGRMIFKPLEQHSAEDMIDVLKVDLLGAFFFIKQAFVRMRPGGAIVNVSSIHAEQTTPLVTAYAAAKAGLLSLTRSAAIEGKAKGLRINAVLPGAVETPMLRENPNIKSGLETLDAADVGQPEDIAAAIAYLACDDAVFVQGAMLRVDGGRLDQL
ncbi:SDR family NAD(P)-dependent oxidoreductase [Ideonella sp. BN130291]|uniref:SDR family NAD(P)-dependent oxidoreductase n=1 Tax=Ideonella sp. BN130291 TaxID=3112940 RepID=UPI002E26B551|nr:SDR family oxidoreductase [Ideonella sp. BN130291]